MKVTFTEDEALVRAIQDKLKENGGFCPCASVKNADTKCMCKAFREQIKAGIQGECHCGLYEVK